MTVDLDVSVDLDCVLLLIVAVPADTPDGSVVLIKDVGVAGCAVVLNEMFLRVIVGFNHAPAHAGAVYAAAAAGDEWGLEEALFDGVSTEECDAEDVSKPNMQYVCQRSGEVMSFEIRFYCSRAVLLL